MKPILRSLKSTAGGYADGRKTYQAFQKVDALVDFMQKKKKYRELENGGIPPNIEEMLKAFDFARGKL